MRQFPLALSLAVLAAGAAQCQTQVHAQVPVPVPEDASAMAYGETNPSCLEWSDGCVVCIRTAALPACSTPGIACQPHATACKTATPAKPE